MANVLVPYSATQINRFVEDTRGSMFVEAISMRMAGPSVWSGELSLYKPQAHKRLFVPNLRFYRTSDGWHIDAPPPYDIVWRNSPPEIFQTLFSALEQGHSQTVAKVDFRTCASLPFIPPEEWRAIPLESDIAEFEMLSYLCQQLKPLVEGKRVLEIAGGGGYTSSWLSQWTEQYLCTDWDIVALQVAFETFRSGSIEYRWIADGHALAELITEACPEVLFCLQPIQPSILKELLEVVCTAMASLPNEPCLLMPLSLINRADFESLFAETSVIGNLLVGRCPLSAVRQIAHHYSDLSARWHSLQWQMRIHKTILPSDINGILGYLRPQDAIFLYEAASLLPDGGVIAEIGSFMGLSSIIMAHAVKANFIRKARLYCVDLWDQQVGSNRTVRETDFFAYSSHQLYEIYKYNIYTSGVNDIVVACCGDSKQIVHQFPDGSIDILFVDGDHAYEGCLADLEHWFPKMKSTGFIIGHDFDWEPVAQAAQTFARKHSLRLQSAQDCPIFFIPMPAHDPRPSRYVRPIELSLYCSI